ncbi:hypothetical protein HHI36_021414 [Cryptolaemus montrouzieri]|uniref:Guanylate cyclase domain-containing protein n=1 Tax=Cryptolaemus montrouzieri TaxID=559131 RepID=A0ABD2MXI2_9CUCU
MFTSKANVEDFIWAIRQRHETIKSEQLKARTTIVQDKTRSADISTVWEKRTKISASLIPDEVIQNVNDYSHKHYNACLLFGDVSGFTELTEKYNQAGKGGPSRLTLVLNGYIGALIQEIMSFGGDIFKFSGDAFLSLWKCKDENQIMRDYVHQALDCALVIQKNYGTFKTDVGTYLRVKLAIAAGPVIFTLIGNEKCSHYIVIGKPVMDVKEAENRSHAGEIVVAPSAWYHVNATDYIAIELDGIYRKVVGVGPSWRHIKDENKYSATSGQAEDDVSDEDQNTRMNMGQVGMFIRRRNIEFALRPVVHQADDASLRKFILPPVMSCIDHDEPIDYLTEMRRVVIMFINLTAKRTSYEAVADLVDECYIEICNNAEKYRGCVNKVSLFDKDIMFVVIFGLRGFKHDLECQYALKCASTTFEFLNSQKGIKTVSIAVTTGKTYCGIVGHTLRREYTVMSLTVNKAARIMMNYPDRVACDSSTFQHSKLEAKHFILQVYKPLKGITNPGPIYEFQYSDSKSEQASVIVNYFPILGRDEEVRLYLDNLDVYLRNAEKISEKLPAYTRMMIIRGWPRQGKTRLLEEFVYRTNREIPIIRVMATEAESKIKYGIIRSILCKMLGFDKISEKAEIQQKIETLLEPIYAQELCCLNELFQLDFEETEEYMTMSVREKDIVMSKTLKNLCYAGLRTVWVITVDRAKFFDETSWKVILAMLACRYLFFVMTLDLFFVLGPEAIRIMKHRNVQIVQLTDIPRIYHAGFACQVLNVFAISADLENLLHSKSNGNPGWMETLLISLKQSHQVFIRNADYRTINHYGLVAPPLYMMRRMSPENILKWKQIMEEKKSTTNNGHNIDDWYLYIDTCRDEMIEVVLREKIHQTISKDRFIPICFLNPKFNCNDVDAELTREGHLIMTFDSLTYQEQLLLKCSSVLGDSFPRSMLVYVLQSDETTKETALVVKSLFEKKVICCAKGDFSEGGNYLLIRDKMLDPTKNPQIECNCVGIYISDELKDLPKYASCGYFRFISSRFRLTTYNLLTDAQKKMFHARAAKYLLRETKRCSSCGGAFFDLAGYCKLEAKPRHSVRKSFSSTDHSDQSSVYGSLYASHTDSRSERTTVSPHSFGKRSNPFSYRSFTPSLGASLGHALGPTLDDDDDDSFYARKFGSMNPLKVLQYKDNYSLTKQFPRADFQTCHCHLILTYMYNQLVCHHRGCGQWLDMINAMIEYAIICMEQMNIAEGLTCIQNALKFLSTSGECLETPAWRIPILEAKLYTWYGALMMVQDQNDEALKMFLVAMGKFGYPFPEGSFGIHIKLWTKKLKQKMGMYLFPDKLIDKKLSDEDNDVMDSISCCLNKMFHLFIQTDKPKQAELAAVWSITRALEAAKSLPQVCGAFGNMILMANYKKNKFWSVVLEVHALRFCHKKRYGIDPPELKSVVKLYYVIFATRLARAEFDEALHMGYILSRLTVAANDVGMIIKTLSKIVWMLMIKMFLSECVTILQEMSYHAMELESPEGKAEYYYCALLFHLNTGYNFVAFAEVEKYYRGECLMVPCSEQRKFLTVLRTWYARTNQWEAAEIVNDQIKLVPKRSNVTEKTLHLAQCRLTIYEIEYQLLILVHKTNRRNIYDKQKIRLRIMELWKELGKFIDNVPLVKTRYLVMKAYEAIIWNNENKMLRNLRSAKKEATKQGNILLQKYIDFLQQFWLDKLIDEQSQKWLQHAEPDNYIEYNQLNNADNVMCYPFPLPLFY